MQRMRLRVRAKLLLGALIGSWFFLVVRYLCKTPQLLENDLPGDVRLYRWTHGNVYYKVYGDEDAPALVLLHTPAVAASSYEMRHLVAGLATGYRVYIPDLPGFGLSDRPGMQYTANVYVTFWRAFLKDVVAQPAVLVASGLSCNYAVALADTPYCAGLALLSPQSVLQPVLRPLPYPFFLSLLLYALVTPRPLLRFIVMKQYGLTQLTPAELNHYSATAHQLGAEYAASAYLTGALTYPVSLERINQPLLVMWGEQATPTHLLAFDSTGTKRELVLSHAGKAVHIDQPEKVVAALLQWWSDVTRKPEEAPAPPVSAPVQQEAISDVQDSQPELTHHVQPVDNSQPEVTVAQQQEQAETEEEVEAYCVKCRQKRSMQHVHKIVLKNGRHALEGVCPVCGTKLFRFIANS